MQREPIETLKYKGYTIDILPDEDASYADSGDHLGHIVYSKSSRYCLGDTPMSLDEIKETLFLPPKEYVDDEEWQEVEEKITAAYNLTQQFPADVRHVAQGGYAEFPEDPKWAKLDRQYLKADELCGNLMRRTDPDMEGESAAYYAAQGKRDKIHAKQRSREQEIIAPYLTAVAEQKRFREEQIDIETRIDKENEDLQYRPDIIAFPVHAYVHSGSTVWVGSRGDGPPGTDCRWDSGQSGFVYCTHAEAMKFLRPRAGHGEGSGLTWKYFYDEPENMSPLTPEEIAQAETILKQEVETFDSYLQGETCGYVIKDDCGEEVDSCWGHDGKGAAKYAMEQAKAAVDRLPPLEGKRERYVQAATLLADGSKTAKVRVDKDPQVERVAGTRTAWVTIEVLVDLDDKMFEHMEEDDEQPAD